MASRSITSFITKPTITCVSSYFKYHVKYDEKTIETIITNESSITKEWINDILAVHVDKPKIVVGLDVKWEPTPSVSPDTFHLCIDSKCLVLQLFYFDEFIAESLLNILMNPRFTFMGFDEDISKFVSYYSLNCAKSEDIRTAVINKWPRRFQQHDLEYLAEK